MEGSKNKNKILLWIDGMYEEFGYQLKYDSLFLFNKNEQQYLGLRKKTKSTVI